MNISEGLFNLLLCILLTVFMCGILFLDVLGKLNLMENDRYFLIAFGIFSIFMGIYSLERKFFKDDDEK